jgi:RNA polymerase sigma factor (sigma-70 family)
LDTRYSDEREIQALWASLRDDLRRRGADAQTAEDMAQEAWVMALRSPPEERGRLRGWMHVVALRRWQRSSMREVERARREREVGHGCAAVLGSAAAADADPSLLWRYVSELDEPYRSTLRLRFWEGLEVAEIAARQRAKPSTVHSHVHRGLARLRARIGEDSRARSRFAGLAPWWLALRRGCARSRARLLGLAGLAASVALFGWLGLAASAGRGPRLAADAPGASSSLALAPSLPAPVPQEAERAALALGAERVVRFSGIVSTPQGTPVAGACVFSGGAEDEPGTPDATTDAAGRFTLEPRGPLLWAAHADWRASPRLFVPSLPAGPVELRLEPGVPAEVEVVASTGERVAGALVVLDPARRGRQSARAGGTLSFAGPPERATTDALGRARLAFPPRSAGEILVVPPSGAGWRGSRSFPAAGETLRLELPAPAVLRGRCLDAAGQPLAARIEVAQLAGLAVRTTVTDPLGLFTVEGLTPGEFVVTALEVRRGRSSSRHVGIARVGDDAPLELHFSELFSILGRVLEGGRPVEGARVELGVSNPQPFEAGRWSTRTDARGAFVLAGCARARAHDLQVFRPGESQASLAVARLMPGREADHALDERPSPLAPVELRLAPGRVPALVELWRESPPLAVVLRPEAGLWRSPPLAAGTYAAFVTEAGAGSARCGTLVHDPRVPREHEVGLPAPGVLGVTLAWPAGARRGEVEVALLMDGPERPELGALGAARVAWSLPRAGADGIFRGSFAPGVHTLVVRGGGLAELHRTVEIFPGAPLDVALHPRLGVATTLRFVSLVDPPRAGTALSSGLLPGELVRLRVLAGGPPLTLALPSDEARRVEDGFEFRVELPPETFALEAVVESPRGEPGASGRVELAPDSLADGALAGRAAGHRITIPLRAP